MTNITPQEAMELQLQEMKGVLERIDELEEKIGQLKDRIENIEFNLEERDGVA